MLFIHRVIIKPYLKKYMAYYVPVEPSFVISDKNKFGGFLINSLKHKRQLKEEDFQHQTEGVSMMVSISEYYEANYGVCISKNDQIRFNNFLFDDFNDKMIDYVAPKLTGKKGDIRRELLNFREKYLINEDDLPFTTMKKQFERALMYLSRSNSTTYNSKNFTHKSVAYKYSQLVQNQLFKDLPSGLQHRIKKIINNRYRTLHHDKRFSC